MPKRAPERDVYAALRVEKLPRRTRWRRRALVLALTVILALAWVGYYLHSMGRGTVLSDARDFVALSIGETVERVLSEDEWRNERFVTLETDANGELAAVTTDTAQVNRFTARLLREITRAAEQGDLDLKVYLGELLGANLLLGRGPLLRFKVGLMTSPDLRLESDFSAAGINQTLHSLTLHAAVDIDLFIPLGAVSSRVETDVLIAQTLIVGKVPGYYYGGS